MDSIYNKTTLFNLMQSGSVVITPNNRLSNELLNSFLQANPKTVQDKPQCLPYGAFLQHCFNKLCHEQPQCSHPFVLTPVQQRHWWRQILGEWLAMEINEGLLKAIAKAWTACHAWQLDLNHAAFAYTIQTQQFQQCALKFQQELRRTNALAEEELVSYLLGQTQYYGEKTLVWACFDDYTPQQRQLQNYLQAKDCQQYHYDLSTQENLLWQYAAKDENDEKKQLIHWVKQRLEKGEQRIAVIVPDLAEKAQAIQRLFLQHFPASAFNISLGKPLSDYPLVAHALCWLSLDSISLSNQQIRLLLHSPYLAYSEEEMLARAQFMEDSDALQEPYLKHATLIKQLMPGAPKLAKLLSNIKRFPEKAAVQEWLDLFISRLSVLGFPGQYSLHSATYECYQRFLLLFAEFKQLTLITPVMTQQQALTAFKDLAQSTIFQPKNFTAAIHILGLLEASGCIFDSLWIMGLTDVCLPQKTKLSAFIPLPLQQKNRMPHADPAQELQLAKKILTRFQNSSHYAVFSYPCLSGDKPNLPSPLIGNLNSLPSCAPTENLMSQLECLNEDYQLPVKQEEPIQGGTAILAKQAKCPFQAFAAHRLHAKPVLPSSEGPNAQERGQLIHKVMELLWQNLQNQQTLLSLSEEELAHHIAQAIHQALEPLIEQRIYSFPKLIQDIEIKRLQRLVYAFLACERQRPPFAVEALEKTFHFNLAEIDFHVRIDRIDRVESDKKWVIDYKSSFPQTTPWNEERPQEPQILLYALLDEAINTILFAQLKTGQTAYKGISEEGKVADGISALKKEENWSACRAQWQEQLQKLAQEFRQGHCPPTPAKPTVCQQCAYANLCRFPF